MLAINRIDASLLQHIQSTLYIDDFCIYSSGAHLGALERRLQLALNPLVQWSNVTGLSFNHGKTHSMHICHRYGYPRLAHTLTINNSPIKSTDTHRFLSVTIDNKLNWKEHICKLRTFCLKSLNVLKHISHIRWGANRISILRLYIMLIKPRLDYGAEVYSSAASGILDRLTPIHNEAIRITMRAFRSSPLLSLYAETGIKPLSVYRDIELLITSLRILANLTHPLHEEALTAAYRSRKQLRSIKEKSFYVGCKT